jgi:hypothetical protein
MFPTRTFLRLRRVEERKSGCEEIWMPPTVMVKICMVVETLMRHQLMFVAQNATRLGTPRLLMTSI